MPHIHNPTFNHYNLTITYRTHVVSHIDHQYSAATILPSPCYSRRGRSGGSSNGFWETWRWKPNSFPQKSRGLTEKMFNFLVLHNVVWSKYLGFYGRFQSGSTFCESDCHMSCPLSIEPTFWLIQGFVSGHSLKSGHEEIFWPKSPGWDLGRIYDWWQDLWLVGQNSLNPLTIWVG